MERAEGGGEERKNCAPRNVVTVIAVYEALPNPTDRGGIVEVTLFTRALVVMFQTQR